MIDSKRNVFLYIIIKPLVNDIFKFILTYSNLRECEEKS